MLRKKTDFMTEYISGKEEEKRREKLRRRHRTGDASVRGIEKHPGLLPVLKFMWNRLSLAHQAFVLQGGGHHVVEAFVKLFVSQISR